MSDELTAEQMRRVAALPNATLEISGRWVGEIRLVLVDVGQPTERVVVERADPFTLASPQLVAEWYSGNARHVDLTRNENGPDVVRFGTEGEGLGVVAYEIGEQPASYDPLHEYPTIPLTRAGHTEGAKTWPSL